MQVGVEDLFGLCEREQLHDRAEPRESLVEPNASLLGDPPIEPSGVVERGVEHTKELPVSKTTVDLPMVGVIELHRALHRLHKATALAVRCGTTQGVKRDVHGLAASMITAATRSGCMSLLNS